MATEMRTGKEMEEVPEDFESGKAENSQKVLMRKSFAKSAFVALFPEKFVTSLKRSLMERNTGDKPVLSEEDRTYFAELISDERDKIIPYMPDAQLLESLYSL